jgi:hypothetical protein
MLNVLRFLLFHEILAAITSLNSAELLLTTYLGMSISAGTQFLA